MAIQRFILGMERLWSWWQFVRRGICYQNSRKTMFQHWWSTMSVAKQEFEYNITKTEQILKWKVHKRFKRDICYASDMSSLLSMHTHDESRNVQNILLLFSLFFIIYCYYYSNYCFRITFWSKLSRFTLLALIYVLKHCFVFHSLKTKFHRCWNMLCMCLNAMSSCLTCQWTRSQPCVPVNSKLLLISR